MRFRAALTFALLAFAAPAAAAPAPALFKAGAAKASIDPLPGVPVFAGGFGWSPPITQTTDDSHMEVRAFYVANQKATGRHGVGIAVVDAQAYFAAYQEDTADQKYGIEDARTQAAAQIQQQTGVPTTKTDLIVQATHTHAGATLEGIWGPVPLPYLKLVHDAVVKTLVDAATGAQDAHLQMGAFDAPWLNNVDIVQTDSYPGWSQDGQVSVLRAVTPAGKPITSFVSVPAHGDIVDAAEDIKKLNPDYFGYVREALDSRLGGLNVVGPATLGRNETPIQVGGIEPSKWFSSVVTSIVGKAMADSRWLTTDTISSAETFTRVPGTNPLLFALVAAWALPDDAKQQMGENTGYYPIDRSIQPPYLTGTAIGTDLTALRIGDNVFLSMPGEPFPEVRNAIVANVTGADHVVALSKAQDDWGYFYPAWVTPFTAVYDSDHHIYNVSPLAGDMVIKTQTDNIGTLGFGAEKAAVSPPLLGNRYEQATRPGLQAMAAPTWGDADPDTGKLTVTFTVIWSDAHQGGASRNGPVHVDFGDGTSTDREPNKRVRFTHDYAPGTYPVRLSGVDSRGVAATWSLEVTVYEPLRPRIEQHGTQFSAHVDGGDGRPLSYEWTFGDDEVQHGPVVTHEGTDRVTLRVVDGTTTVATTTIG